MMITNRSHCPLDRTLFSQPEEICIARQEPFYKQVNSAFARGWQWISQRAQEKTEALQQSLPEIDSTYLETHWEKIQQVTRQKWKEIPETSAGIFVTNLVSKEAKALNKKAYKILDRFLSVALFTSYIPCSSLNRHVVESVASLKETKRCIEQYRKEHPRMEKGRVCDQMQTNIETLLLAWDAVKDQLEPLIGSNQWITHFSGEEALLDRLSKVVMSVERSMEHCRIAMGDESARVTLELYHCNALQEVEKIQQAVSEESRNLAHRGREFTSTYCSSVQSYWSLLHQIRSCFSNFRKNLPDQCAELLSPLENFQEEKKRLDDWIRNHRTRVVEAVNSGISCAPLPVDQKDELSLLSERLSQAIERVFLALENCNQALSIPFHIQASAIQ